MHSHGMCMILLNALAYAVLLQTVYPEELRGSVTN